MSGTDVELSQDIWVGVRAYFHDQFRRARDQREKIEKCDLTADEFNSSLVATVKVVICDAIDSDDSEKNLRDRSPLVHKLLADLFLPGGPFHGVEIDFFGWMNNNSLWAPLLQLYMEHPGELQGLQEPLFNHLAWLHIESREGVPAKDRLNFAEDMSYLAGQLGPVHYWPLVADVMRNFGKFVRNYTVLDTLHDAGGLDTLLKWDADILTVCDRGLIDLPTCMARPPMYAKLVRIIFQLTDHLEEQGILSVEEVGRRRGVLLQAGLEASGRLKSKNEDEWRPLLDRVVGYKNLPLTPRQLLSFVKIYEGRAGYDEALAELKAFGSKEVVKAIKTDYVSVERSERIRTLGVADGINQNKLLRLTGEAFSRDLGL